MANAENFNARTNARQAIELVLKGEHIALKNLQLRDDIKGKMSVYLSKNIPDYPTPVEFHITELAHVTNKISIQEIWKSGGFKGLDGASFSWWSLKVNEADMRAAEERFLESKIPNRSKEERAAQQPILRLFTTSPLFQNETSRYGNFRFTFPLAELMEAYKKQMCEGEEPVLRVYGTKLFKQEIEYVVLVHGPQFNEKFRDFPELTSNPIVKYDGNQIIWKAQAICETHNFQLAICGNTAVETRTSFPPFYVWDQVSFVFHTNGILTFPKRKLKAILSCCEIAYINLSKGENCFLVEAEKFCSSLPDDESEKEDEIGDEIENEKEEHKCGEIQMEVD